MTEFNPLFNFQYKDDDVSAIRQYCQISESNVIPSRSIDDIIQKYRNEKTKEIFNILDEDVEIESLNPVLKHKITDSVRNKSKVKRKKVNADEEEQEPQYEFAQTITKYTAVSSFMEFKISKPLLKVLTEMLIYKPTPIQCSCIPITLMNRDVCACAQTGSGKTLAFLLPIIDRLVYAPTFTRSSTKVLIISPTRELAVQIFKVAEQLVKYCPKLKIQLAAGGLDLSSQEASLRTNPDIVVATPGRLIDHLSNAPNFTLQGIEYLVLDEADKLLDDYFTEQIGEIIRNCNSQRQTLLFSATMTESVKELAVVSLKNPVRVFLNQSTAVAQKLEQEFVRIRPQKEKDRDAVLAALLVRSFSKRTIVFLPTKKDCHRMHVLLGLLGLQCAELHGDMNQAQRLEALRRFTEIPAVRTETDKNPPVDILLATDLAARGLDIPLVHTVINYKLPRSIKQYVHRVGRTARSTNTGKAVSLAGECDRKLLKEIVKDAPCPVKARVIPPEVISRFNTRILKIQPFLEEILTTEAEDRELQAAASQIAKVERLAAENCTNPNTKKQSGQLPPFKPKRINWFSEKKDALRMSSQTSAKNKKKNKSITKKIPKKR